MRARVRAAAYARGKFVIRVDMWIRCVSRRYTDLGLFVSVFVLKLFNSDAPPSPPSLSSRFPIAGIFWSRDRIER